MKVSIIIPAFNEEKVVLDCLNSLKNQSYKDFEIIVIDDGSTDKTLEILQQNSGIKLLSQSHLGPGIARNSGAKIAKGDILVFVDADMTFDQKFIEKLVEPITRGESVGTFSKDEYVFNKENIWSRSWNINKGLPVDRMHPENYPETQSVFRAILKKEFLKTSGFRPIGYVDDYTLSDQLGVNATLAKNAIFYHRNPENLLEVYKQARWVGKSEYKKRKIRNENLMRLVSIVRYNPVFSLINGLVNAIRYRLPQYIIFKLIYDIGIEVSLLKSFFGEQAYK